MDYKLTTYDEMDTIELAQNIESEKFPNMVICLDGELGSGKTVFAKGIAQALGISETITSPTYTIIKEYNSGELPFYHMDVYRLDGNTDGVGIEEYFNNKNQAIYNEWLDKCNIHSDEENEIKVNDYRDYKPNGDFFILTGSLEDIFDKFTTHNDKLKYCNGDFWRFADADIEILYSLFITNYNGNYFLDNAVKRGVTID